VSNTFEKQKNLNIAYDRKILNQISKATSVVTTLINICVCYSRLGKH